MKDNLCYVIVYKVKRSEFEPRGRQCHSISGASAREARQRSTMGKKNW